MLLLLFKNEQKTYQLSLIYLQFKGLGRIKLKLRISQINSYHGQAECGSMPKKWADGPCYKHYQRKNERE